MTTATHDIHFGIAEAGKAAAIRGDHVEALRHYREALRLANAAKAPEVFFRHYTQCVLESLELTGAYNEVIEFCENAAGHYATAGTTADLHARDHGSILERLGVVLLKSGDVEAGKDALSRAIAIAGKGALPLAETVHGWLIRGMAPDLRRLSDQQKKHKYFTVRADQIDEARARPLPKPQKKDVRSVTAPL